MGQRHTELCMLDLLCLAVGMIPNYILWLQGFGHQMGNCTVEKPSQEQYFPISNMGNVCVCFLLNAAPRSKNCMS